MVAATITAFAVVACGVLLSARGAAAACACAAGTYCIGAGSQTCIACPAFYYCAGGAADKRWARPLRSVTLDSRLVLFYYADDQYVYISASLSRVSWIGIGIAQPAGFNTRMMYPSRPVIGTLNSGVGTVQVRNVRSMDSPSLLTGYTSGYEPGATVASTGGRFVLSYKRKWDTGQPLDGNISKARAMRFCARTQTLSHIHARAQHTHTHTHTQICTPMTPCFATRFSCAPCMTRGRRAAPPLLSRCRPEALRSTGRTGSPQPGRSVSTRARTRRG